MLCASTGNKIKNISQTLQIALFSPSLILINSSLCVATAEVNNPCISKQIDENIARLHISPDDTSIMECFHTILDLLCPTLLFYF